SWLDGREERQDWTHVWQALLERPNALPAGIDERVLCSKGLSWLDGREERQDWPVLWEKLARMPDWGSQRWERLAGLGMGWLRSAKNLENAAASRFVEVFVDKKYREPEFLDLASQWLETGIYSKPGPIFAAKFIALHPASQQAWSAAVRLERMIAEWPNKSLWLRLETLLNPLRFEDGTHPAIESLHAALDHRNSNPAWDRAREACAQKTLVLCRVIHVRARDIYNVELELGLLAELSCPDLRKLTVGTSVNVIVTSVAPEKGRVRVSMPANSIVVSPVKIGGEYVGTVTGVKDFGVFVSVCQQTGLIRRSTFPPDEDFRSKHPVGSAIQVRVADTTPRGLVLERVSGTEQPP
ncbi:MAG: hypothetical protein HYV27_22640, partial [Candidatus Hydrogenedentes bacterium]|nr:hypothetical protein [Candidatus Hydrogenedentota bacterium]